jgi:hypothetical protein
LSSLGLPRDTYYFFPLHVVFTEEKERERERERERALIFKNINASYMITGIITFYMHCRDKFSSVYSFHDITKQQSKNIILKLQDIHIFLRA